jgi:exodeoxyribonuclease VII large subunit
MPGTRVVLYPAPVQGQGAAELIATAIRTASARAETDVLIVCRGGGSLEDLWSFNEEVVARAIAASAIPVVSGVGHETDFTIADFVADARAPTPTAAAELVSASRAELLPRLQGLATRLVRNLERLLGTRAQQIDYLARRLVHPGERIGVQARHLEHLAARLRGCARRAVEAAGWRVTELGAGLRLHRPDIEGLLALQKASALRLGIAHARYMALQGLRLERAGASLALLDPGAVLERGYSIVTAADGRIVRSAAEVQPRQRVGITFGQGAATAFIDVARIEDVTKDKP